MQPPICRALRPARHRRRRLWFWLAAGRRVGGIPQPTASRGLTEEHRRGHQMSHQARHASPQPRQPTVRHHSHRQWATTPCPGHPRQVITHRHQRVNRALRGADRSPWRTLNHHGHPPLEDHPYTLWTEPRIILPDLHTPGQGMTAGGHQDRTLTGQQMRQPTSEHSPRRRLSHTHHRSPGARTTAGPCAPSRGSTGGPAHRPVRWSLIHRRGPPECPGNPAGAVPQRPASGQLAPARSPAPTSLPHYPFRWGVTAPGRPVHVGAHQGPRP